MRMFLTLFLLVAAPAVLAHSGHGDVPAGFMAGVSHSLTGLDHLLAMLAVGLWSATTARRIWLAPLGFAVLLLTGALLAGHGLLALPGVEPMIVVSVLVLGLLVMARIRLPDVVAAGLVALFALFHGAAHGQELGSGTALAGMVLATLALHLAGVVLGLVVKAYSPWWQRGLGAGIAAAGAGLALGLI